VPNIQVKNLKLLGLKSEHRLSANWAKNDEPLSRKKFGA